MTWSADSLWGTTYELRTWTVPSGRTEPRRVPMTRSAWSGRRTKLSQMVKRTTASTRADVEEEDEDDGKRSAGPAPRAVVSGPAMVLLRAARGGGRRRRRRRRKGVGERLGARLAG
jgi:hypothetical protein